MDAEHFYELYNMRFKDHLQNLCRDHIANHLVQKLITECKDKAIISMIIEELLPFLSNLLSNCAGVILALLRASNAYEVKQKELVDAICNEAAISQQNNDEADSEDPKKKVTDRRDASLHFLTNLLTPPNYLTSQIGQELLQFPAQKGGNVVLSSLLSMSRKTLLDLAKNSQGSRFVEAVFKSPLVKVTKEGEKSATSTMLARFKGRYGELACSSCGCHVAEACYAIGNAGEKEMIVKELVTNEREISQTKWGQIVLLTCRVADYKQQHEGWLKAIEKNERRKQQFAGILDSEKSNGNTKIEAAVGEEENEETYDYFMEKLGFGKKERNEDKKKGKKAKKAKTTTAEDDAEDVKGETPVARNDIDDLFEGKKSKRSDDGKEEPPRKKSKKERKAEREKASENSKDFEITDPEEKASDSVKQVKEYNDPSMKKVLAALDKSTDKKKKKKKSVDEGKKKKKFSMM